MTDAGDAEDAGENQQPDSDEPLHGLESQTTTPPGSPPQGAPAPPATTTLKPPPAQRTAGSRNSGSQTPAASTAAPTPVPQLVDPEDDVLSDSDLPGPWVEDYDPPATEAECEDKADFLLQTRFPPMTDVDQIVATLTKFAPAQRSTETLYRLAENTQSILQAWQDEYLELDKQVRIVIAFNFFSSNLNRPHLMHIRPRSPPMAAGFRSTPLCGKLRKRPTCMATATTPEKAQMAKTLSHSASVPRRRVDASSASAATATCLTPPRRARSKKSKPRPASVDVNAVLHVAMSLASRPQAPTRPGKVTVGAALARGVSASMLCSKTRLGL